MAHEMVHWPSAVVQALDSCNGVEAFQQFRRAPDTVHLGAPVDIAMPGPSRNTSIVLPSAESPSVASCPVSAARGAAGAVHCPLRACFGVDVLKYSLVTLFRLPPVVPAHGGR